MSDVNAALERFESLFIAAGVGQEITGDPLTIRETPMLDALEVPAQPIVVMPVVPQKSNPKKKRVRIRKPTPKREKVYPPHILDAVQYVQPRNQTPPYTLHSLYMDMRKRGCPEIEGNERRIVAEAAGVVVKRINGVDMVVGRLTR